MLTSRSIRAALVAALLMPAAGFAAPAPADRAAHRYVKDGLVIEFSASPLAEGAKGLMEDELAELRFRIVEQATGKPVRGLAPGAWLDFAGNIRNKAGAEQKSCKDKIALYLRGIVGIRPMVDLNNYYVVILNREATLSVVDPKVSMAGRTSTLASVPLPGPGGDLVSDEVGRRLFVTVPSKDKVVAVEVDSFKVIATVPSGANPVRAALQPDGRYLWVGNNGRKGEAGGVTVIDTVTLKPRATIATGRGHHEIAFSDDSRWAFVTNRRDGTVSVIDVRELKPVRDLAIGGQPISIAFSALSKTLYVADAQGGVVHAIRPGTLETLARIELKPGLGPMRFTEDGRWGLVTNTSEDRVSVIDPSRNTVQHEIQIQGQPYQVAVTRAFAYVRSLGSERVSMIDVASFGAGKTPRVLSFQAGGVPPKAAGELAIANSIAPAPGEAGVLVVNPGDNTTYFYMEGMNAASSNYRVYGASARAVAVVDRSLQEIEPGVYASRVKMPVAGRLDVAFSLDSPRLLHCFSTEAAANPRLADIHQGLTAEYLVDSHKVKAGETTLVRFRIHDARGPRRGLDDVQVLSMLAPGRHRTVVAAREVGEGVYEAPVKIAGRGAYYVYLSSRKLGKGYNEMPYLSLLATQDGAAPVAARKP